MRPPRKPLRVIEDEFARHLLDLLGRAAPLELRRMFGGHGLFREGLMFALVLDETLYLKTDAANRGDFEALGLAPFTYERAGRRVALSYHRAPDSLFDDAEEAARWARSAFEAALRQHLAGPRKASGRRARRSD